MSEKKSLLELLDDAVNQTGHKVKCITYVIEGKKVELNMILEKEGEKVEEPTN